MKSKKLTDLCNPKQWKTIAAKELLEEGYPVYGANGIVGYWREYNHETETLAIACRGTCGTVNVIPPKSYINGNAMCLDNISDDVDLKYLFYYLKAYDFNKVISGTAVPQITIESLKKIDVLIPSKKEQKRIVYIFDILSQIIESKEKENKRYDDLIKARFVEMFGDYLKYDRRPLSEVAIITGGLTKNSNRNTFETKMPYLRVANVFYNRLDLREILKIGVKEEEIEKTLLQAGDLLFVEGNGSIEQIGRVAIWDGSIDPILHQNHLIKARFNNEIIAPEYALFYFMLQDGRQQIISKSVSTSGLNTLSVNKVSSLLLPIPPIALQKQFSVFVKLVDKSRFDIKKSITELEREVVYD